MFDSSVFNMQTEWKCQTDEPEPWRSDDWMQLDDRINARHDDDRI